MKEDKVLCNDGRDHKSSKSSQNANKAKKKKMQKKILIPDTQGNLIGTRKRDYNT